MNEQARQMIKHLTHEVLQRPDHVLDENTPLVSSGLIDSFALIDVLMKLEDITGLRIPAGKVQAKDMDTVTLMFATAARVGKTRGN